MASLNEIKKVDYMFRSKKIEHQFLHCISSYPTIEENSYLNNIKFLSKMLKTNIGLSLIIPMILIHQYTAIYWDLEFLKNTSNFQKP